jgi:integrase
VGIDDTFGRQQVRLKRWIDLGLSCGKRFRSRGTAAIRHHHLTIDINGVGIELPHTKTAQDHAVWVPILRQPTSRWDPLAALETWQQTLAGRDTDGGGIWLHITKGDTFGTRPHPISGDAINNIIGRRVLAAGLTDGSGYSAHSLRSGFITEAKNRGIDEADIMKHSRHKSLEMMRLYDRTAGWWNRNATANLVL